MASLSPLFKPIKSGNDGNKSEECSGVVGKAKEQVEELTNLIQLLKIEHSKLMKDEVSQALLEQLTALENELAKLEDLYKLRSLLVTLELVKEAHNAIEHLLSLKYGKSKHESDLRLIQAVDQFDYIRKACETTINTCPPDNSLRIYVEKVLVHWQETLSNLLVPKFEKCLESLNWPVAEIDSLPESQVSSSSCFDNFFLSLLKLDIRLLFLEGNDTEIIHVSLPIEIMIKPLKKRFFHHFMRKTSRTNQIEKVG